MPVHQLMLHNVKLVSKDLQFQMVDVFQNVLQEKKNAQLVDQQDYVQLVNQDLNSNKTDVSKLLLKLVLMDKIIVQLVNQETQETVKHVHKIMQLLTENVPQFVLMDKEDVQLVIQMILIYVQLVMINMINIQDSVNQNLQMAQDQDHQVEEEDIYKTQKLILKLSLMEVFQPMLKPMKTRMLLLME